MTVSTDLYVHMFRSFATQAETWFVERGGTAGSAVLAICGCEADALARAREIAGYDRCRGRHSRIHLQLAGGAGWKVVSE